MFGARGRLKMSPPEVFFPRGGGGTHAPWGAGVPPPGPGVPDGRLHNPGGGPRPHRPPRRPPPSAAPPGPRRGLWGGASSHRIRIQRSGTDRGAPQWKQGGGCHMALQPIGLVLFRFWGGGAPVTTPGPQEGASHAPPHHRPPNPLGPRHRLSREPRQGVPRPQAPCCLRGGQKDPEPTPPVHSGRKERLSGNQKGSQVSCPPRPYEPHPPAFNSPTRTRPPMRKHLRGGVL